MQIIILSDKSDKMGILKVEYKLKTLLKIWIPSEKTCL